MPDVLNYGYVPPEPADPVVPGSSPARCEDLFNRKRGSIAHSLSLSPHIIVI